MDECQVHYVWWKKQYKSTYSIIHLHNILGITKESIMAKSRSMICSHGHRVGPRWNAKGHAGTFVGSKQCCYSDCDDEIPALYYFKF